MSPFVSESPVCVRLSVRAVPTSDARGHVSSLGSSAPNLFGLPSSDGPFGSASLQTALVAVGFGVRPDGKCRTSVLSASTASLLLTVNGSSPALGALFGQDVSAVAP